MTQDLYKELGLERGASKDDIQKAYRKKAAKSHPDRGGNGDDFKVIAKAYEVLFDDDKRKRYDETGETERNGLTPEDVVRQMSVEAFCDHNAPIDWMKQKVDATRSRLNKEISINKETSRRLVERLNKFKSKNKSTKNTAAFSVICECIEQKIEAMGIECGNLETNVAFASDVLTYLNGLKDSEKLSKETTAFVWMPYTS